MTKSGILLAVMLGATSARADTKIDFPHDVWPILQSRCVSCHGADKQKSGLRLDTRAGYSHTSDEQVLLQPGSPERSSLFRRVSLSVEDADVMPPEGQPLAQEQIEIIRRWIAQGGGFGAWNGVTPVMSLPPAPGSLPVVPAADARALARARGAGALIVPVSRDSHLLEVSFPDATSLVGARGLAALAPLAAHVVRLDLSGAEVKAAGLATLGPLPHLEILLLANAAIDDHVLAALSGLPALRRLNLYATRVSDAGLGALERLPQLRKVVLTETPTSAEARQRLRTARPEVLIIE